MIQSSGKPVPAVSTFRVLDASVDEDAYEWARLWGQWAQREVQAHPAYSRLFVDKRSAALCATLSAPEGTILFPFLLRSLSHKPYAHAVAHGATDIVTPYGYGGAFCWGPAVENLTDQFWTTFTQWASTRQVVSEFIRFSLEPESMLSYPGTIEFKQDNVVRDLEMPAEVLWMDFDHKVRKNVKKAERSGVVVEVDEEGVRFEEFFEIYERTMDRRDAGTGYYFPREFFNAIHQGLSGQYVYFHALHGGKVISTELVLVSIDSTYSFLGGTDSEYFDLRPNDLLKHRAMLWAIAQGKRRFVLGGGYAPNDGIFRYKRAFAPNGARPFSVGSRVLRPRVYLEMSAAAGSGGTPSDGYFPAYRAGPRNAQSE
ncbi:GNAT family N-acetyltransferase [Cryobacterium glaciale]|uniref:GNAT family N-acetyltransferase n=1 Tax=Cryobacterium glaciale TaxID=1259145 RepID=A0A4R8UTY4_9MICO|nr:GNAT family N-acetyltransferase [Cryobacterium glaciale]TFB71891.1 GNAT family N-acetyltransferase [Cryobacterium glaciale]